MDRLRRARGLHVVFMGVDGAGKTTTIANVSAQLGALGRVPFANVYMGPWGQFQTAVLSWAYARGFAPPEDWWKRATAPDRDVPLLHCAAKWLRGRVSGAGYYLAVYYEMWRRYRTLVRPRLRRGEIVLSDRYMHDLRYLHHSRRITVFPLVRRLWCRLFPKPHVVFFLFNDPEVIASRKAQLEADEIREFQETYRLAMRGLPVVEVKTDLPADEIATRVTSSILERYYRRR